ncbi:hypothetical protein PC41400_14770 [Paenibacillus chitinolyticus]|uniref:DUF4393 domain-containing protein n=1 Tax=Paenibacillus chitinolyticus TaxID=79263 RepID=A0A410WX62_9BACL|nr:hypothetical protein [Paenibacillus chitinolyticus]MCY9593963.1 hypothetical protein [Paenibacillus chitinolyticus]MCY9599618.1 hypothetical protein [Paenibacillus chitinolyticus]QAV18872.1 hypothetical protein PC41400_14770 [Paenibacillus chitinolyticus]
MSIDDNFKNTKGDIVHATIKSTISAIPAVGGFLSEYFGLVVTSPAEKRKENILVMLDQRLNELNNKIETFDIYSLSNNEAFLSVVLQAINISIRTHQIEKRAALLNAVSNSALTNSIDENRQQMFLSFIDSFNEWHLKILFFLNDPKQNLQKAGHSIDLDKGSIGLVIFQYYPQLSGELEFTKLIMSDLYNRGLISKDSSDLHTIMGGSGMVASRTSALGKQFIQFINTPDELS